MSEKYLSPIPPGFPEPAFPHVQPEGHCTVYLGMTLRDYAAIKFAAAMLANPEHSKHLHNHDLRQALAFNEADAFLKARQA